MGFRLEWLVGAALAFPVAGVAADQVDVNCEMQNVDARFRLFKTTNLWNFLELDTQTGRIWQVQFTVSDSENRMKIPLVPDVEPDSTKPGRFTLSPTRNMYNFILLDQDNGRTWQVQWSTSGNSGIWPIESRR